MLYVQPDQPRLCVFYLEGLLLASMTAGIESSFQILQGLVTFLWRWTWACVPDFLRPTLLDALHSAGTRWGADLHYSPKAGSMALLSRTAAWALQGDEQFVAWAAERPRHTFLQSECWREAATHAGSDEARYDRGRTQTRR